MAKLETPEAELGTLAPDFALLGVDGQTWTLESVKGQNGLLVMFICNHCPYVKAIQHKLIRDTRDLLEHGVRSVAIMSNDVDQYPEDSLQNMQKVSEDLAYPFPYLIDTTQDVAKRFGAVCTPDFFGFNKNLELQYRGRIDAAGLNRLSQDKKLESRELYEAMLLIAQTGKGPARQMPSIGCSIKWK